MLPPSCVAYTPMSVAAYSVNGAAGSIVSEFTGTSGMPMPAGTQVAAPPDRLFVLQMCCPAATP